MPIAQLCQDLRIFTLTFLDYPDALVVSEVLNLNERYLWGVWLHRRFPDEFKRITWSDDNPEMARLISIQRFKIRIGKKNTISFEYLKFSGCLSIEALQLTKIPEFIGQFITLRELWCGGNYLKRLPEAIGQLAELSLLSCEYNRLTALPQSIGKLRNLRRLWCHDNKITSLPDTLRQLKDLQCFRNPIIPGGIPDSLLGKFPKLSGQFGIKEN